jgi:Zn-dependent peptidase ImmA (M78 family)
LKELYEAFLSRLSELTRISILSLEYSKDPPEVLPATQPRIYLASPLTGFQDVSPEWLWTRGVSGATGSERSRPDSWSETFKERGELAHNWQKEQNNRVAYALRAIGLYVYVPHEVFDPETNADKSAREVDDGDRNAIAQSDCVVALSDFPATGEGKELVLAENSLQPTIVLSSITTRISRLVLGTTHSLVWYPCEPTRWPQAAIDQVMTILGELSLHALVREVNAFKWSSIVRQLPAEPIRSSKRMGLARIMQLRNNPHLLDSSSFAEFDEFFQCFGFQLSFQFKHKRSDSLPRLTEVKRSSLPPSEIVRIANETISNFDTLFLDQPNSAEAIRKALSVPPMREDPSLEFGAQTIRKDHQFQITIKESESRRRSNFSLAHELAHIIFEGEELAVSHRSRLSRIEPIETNVDWLAACLLLPQEWLATELNRNKSSSAGVLDVKGLNDLANKAGVSPEVVALRLTLLDEDHPVIYLRAEHKVGGWTINRKGGVPAKWYPNSIQYDLSTIPLNIDRKQASKDFVISVSVGDKTYICTANVTRHLNEITLVLSDFAS